MVAVISSASIPLDHSTVTVILALNSMVMGTIVMVRMIHMYADDNNEIPDLIFGCTLYIYIYIYVHFRTCVFKIDVQSLAV